MNKDKEPESIAARIPIRLEWKNNDSLKTVYSNQLLVTHAGAEFYLIFGEVVPPTILDGSQIPEYLDIEPVTRIAVSHEMMEKFIEVLNENLSKFKAQQGQFS
jgi:hypothetical protein